MSSGKKSKDTVFILSGSALLSFGITLSLFSALEYDFLSTFLSIFVAWLGFLIAHYGVTGKFMHDYDLDNIGSFHPLESKKRLLSFFLGIFIMSAGFVGGVYFAETFEIFKSLIFVMSFVVGFMFLHYGSTGTLL